MAEDLKHTVLEYACGGRFFASIVLHEGGKMVKMLRITSAITCSVMHQVDEASSEGGDVRRDGLQAQLWNAAHVRQPLFDRHSELQAADSG